MVLIIICYLLLGTYYDYYINMALMVIKSVIVAVLILERP